MAQKLENPPEKLEEKERNEGLHLEIDKSKLESQVKPGLAGHHWRQQGPYLVCQSCPVNHAVWIGMNVRLMGINDDGSPILKRIERRR